MANPFKIAKKKAVESLATKSSDNVTWYGDLGWSSMFEGTSTGDSPPQSYERFVLDAWRKNAVVRSCVQELITSLSEAPIRAYTLTEDNTRDYLSGHPANDLFQQPNNRDSYVELIERSGQHYFLGGNTFWEKRRTGAGRVENLIPIRPDKVVSASVDRDNFPIAFKVLTGKNHTDTRWITLENIVHIPDIDPLNEVFGMPRLISALTEVQADNEATMYVNEVLHNHGSPGTVIMVDAEQIRGQHLLDRAEAKWQDKFGPGEGRGKAAFLPGAHGIKEIGFNLKDLEFRDMRDVARSSICAVFGVDPMIIGVSGSRGGTLSGNEHIEARRKLWMQTIIPLIRRWESALNAFLAPEYGDIKLGFDTREVVALQENRSSAITRAQNLARTGTATLPEIREEAGLSSEPRTDDPIVVSGRIEYREQDKLIEEEEEVPQQTVDQEENEDNDDEEDLD